MFSFETYLSLNYILISFRHDYLLKQQTEPIKSIPTHNAVYQSHDTTSKSRNAANVNFAFNKYIAKINAKGVFSLSADISKIGTHV